MDSKTLTANKTRDIKYYIKSIIGIAIMLFFGRLIPAPAPMTQVGMIVIGQFIGLIFLWTFVDMVWPTFVGIVLFGFVAFDVFPNSGQIAGIYEAGMQSMGSWVTVIVITLLFFTEVLSEAGLIRRFALWFITRKAARKGGWSFTIMFFLATLIVGLFLNVTATQVIMLAVAKEIFQLSGMTEKDKWPRVITVGLTFICIVTYAMTPFCHDLTLLFMGIYSAISGNPVNWGAYTAVGLPFGIIILAGLFAWFRFVVKPDMSKLKDLDFDKLDALRPGPMTKREKIVSLLTGVLFVCWIIPGILSVFSPNSPIAGWFNMITFMTPLMVVVILFAIIRVDGKPVLDLPVVAKRISWLVVFFLAGIMMIATAMGEPTTGISDWVMSITAPLVQNLSPWALIAMLGVLSVILTNVANNVPVGIIFTTIGVPLALQLGINPFVAALAITLGSQMAFCIPPAFVPIGMCYADPYGGAKYTFRWGVVSTIIACVVCALVIYPLGMLVS